MSRQFVVDGDRFSPEPGKYDCVICGICQAQMNVQMNCYGPTGWTEAMGKHGHLHDKFTCPYIEEDWHIQVKALKKEANRSVSKQIEDILLKEAEDILATRIATKNVSKYG